MLEGRLGGGGDCRLGAGEGGGFFPLLETLGGLGALGALGARRAISSGGGGESSPAASAACRSRRPLPSPPRASLCAWLAYGAQGTSTTMSPTRRLSCTWPQRLLLRCRRRHRQSSLRPELGPPHDEAAIVHAAGGGMESATTTAYTVWYGWWKGDGGGPQMVVV